jgi:LysM repeat protein
MAVNTLKNAALLVVMGAVLYFVYVTLNKPQNMSLATTPLRHQHESLAPPAIEMSGGPVIQQPPVTPPPLFTAAPAAAGSQLPPPNIPPPLPAPEPTAVAPAGHQTPVAQLDPQALANNLPPPPTAENPLRSTYETGTTAPAAELVPVGTGRRSAYEAPAASSAPNDAPPVAPEIPVAPNYSATPAVVATTPLTAPPVATNPNRGLDRDRNLAAYSLKRDFDRADEAMQANRFAEALSILTPYHSNPNLTSEDREILHRWLDALAGKVIYSPEHHLAEGHKVSRGETLLTIGERYKTPWSLLQNINNIRDPMVLVAGTTLKIVPGPIRAEVDLTHNELTLYVQNLYAGRFPFSLGDEPPLPGDYHVRSKSMERAYYSREARTIQANDPANPYGGYWIDLGNGAVLHGSPLSTNPRTANLGCVGFSPQDAKDIYSILPEGAAVTIRR